MKRRATPSEPATQRHTACGACADGEMLGRRPRQPSIGCRMLERHDIYVISGRKLAIRRFLLLFACKEAVCGPFVRSVHEAGLQGLVGSEQHGSRHDSIDEEGYREQHRDHEFRGSELSAEQELPSRVAACSKWGKEAGGGRYRGGQLLVVVDGRIQGTV